MRDVDKEIEHGLEQKKLELKILELKIKNELTSLQQYIKGFIAGFGLALALVGFVLRVLLKGFFQKQFLRMRFIQM